jgi:hypothetical protein
MEILSVALRSKVRAAADQCFTMDDFYKGAVIFRNQKVKYDDFTLFYERLTEDQILKIVEILVAVYEKHSPDTQKVEFNHSPTQRSLNNSTDYSAKFVNTVLNEEKDVLHKLLLLTSGKKYLEASNVDLMCELAIAKKDWDQDYSVIFKNPARYTGLKDYYILPGVFQGTMMPNSQGLRNRDFDKDSIQSSLRLLAFLSNDCESKTLEDHFALELSEAIRTDGTLLDFRAFGNATALLLSEYYRDLPMDMTAAELDALSKILMSSSDHKFPKEILANRCKAMASKKDRREMSGPGSVWRYMSDDEVESLKAGEHSLKIYSILSNLSLHISRPPVVYAVFAEIIAVKGEKQVLSIGQILENVTSLRNSSPHYYEAIVGLISEIFKPENDGLPFAWVAQMSEYSWVINSDDSRKESLPL